MNSEKKQILKQLIGNGFFTAILVAVLGVFALGYALLK